MGRETQTPIREKEEEKMICPLKEIRTNEPRELDCEKEQCAWWVIPHPDYPGYSLEGRCAVYELALKTFRVKEVKSLDIVREKK